MFEFDSLSVIQDTVFVFDTVRVELVEKITLSEATKQTLQSMIQKPNDFFSGFLLPAFSIILAFLALYVTYKALVISKKHNEITVKPLLIFRLSTDHKNGKARIYIANKGLGPLIFTKFSIFYNDKQYSHIYDLFKDILNKFEYSLDIFDPDYRSFVYPLNDYSLKVEEEKTLLKYQLNNKNEEMVREFFSEVNKIRFDYSFIDLYKNEEKGSYIVHT